MNGKPIDIYLRESRDRRGRSLQGQLARCRARLAALGLPEGQVFSDRKSAWDPRASRPGFDGLMARVESGVSGGMIVFDLERFSRRPADGERLIEAAERGLTVLDSETAFDLTTADGKKHFRDGITSAAYYSDRLSTRVTRGKELASLDAAPQGRATRERGPFGFEPDGVTPHPVEGEILRDLTARFLSGESQDKIIADLNGRGITTAFGKPWSRSGLRQVLTRPLNAGQVEYKGRVVATLGFICANCGRALESRDGGWEHARHDPDRECDDPQPRSTEPYQPVIDPADLAQVLATYAGNRAGRRPSEQYVTSGFAVCGRCGHALHGRPRRNMLPYPDGEPRRQYWCNRSAGGCGGISVDLRAMDTAARVLVTAILSDPRHAAQVEEAARQAADKAAVLDGKITEAEELAGKLADRLGRGEITLDRYDAATRPLDGRLAKLRAERAALPEGTPGEGVPAGTEAEWRARWDAADVREKRAMLRMALRGRKIAVGPANMSDRTNVAGRLELITPGDRPVV